MAKKEMTGTEWCHYCVKMTTIQYYNFRWHCFVLPLLLCDNDEEKEYIYKKERKNKNDDETIKIDIKQMAFELRGLWYSNILWAPFA